MNIKQSFGVSLQALKKHKLRTFLIILAIVIGIATLTVVVSMTEGANKQVKQRMEKFGPDVIMLMSGGGRQRGDSTAVEANLSQKDIEDIANIEGVKLAAPFQMEREIPTKYGNKFTDSWLFGVEPNWKNAWRRDVSRGDFITDADNQFLSKVCVIGHTVAEDLFGDADPVGEDILIKNVSFKVVGILEEMGQAPMGSDFDNVILIPFNTFSRRLMNQRLYARTMRIIIDNPSRAGDIAGQIKKILRENHRLAAAEEDDFRIMTAEGIAKRVKSTSKTLGVFLWLIAVISPLVGGIVLMNIMLIAVSERKMEIGLRRAVGAKKKHIVYQFLSESLVLTFAGGIIGVGMGIIISVIISLSGKPISIAWQPFAIAFFFSALIGIFFGIYPAQKAAGLDPVKALSQK